METVQDMRGEPKIQHSAHIEMCDGKIYFPDFNETIEVYIYSSDTAKLHKDSIY